MLKPIKRQSLSEAVFEQLRDQIVAGSFGAGELLPAERVLSEKLGVNRGALREALKKLEQARLVSIQHGGSTRVLDFRHTAGMELLTQLLVGPSGFNLEVARSVVEMRTALAPDIARLCAERRDAGVVERLEGVLLAMEAAAGDLPTIQRIAMDFWSELVDGSGNLAYRLALNTLREVYLQLQGLLTETLSDELSFLVGYRAVVDAVKKQDGARAAKKAKELVTKGGDKLIAALDAALELKGS